MTFNELDFQPHGMDPRRPHARPEFPNGYGTSVIDYDHVNEGTWEIMPQKGGRNCSRLVGGDWPKCGLSPAEITRWLQWIEALPMAGDD